MDITPIVQSLIGIIATIIVCHLIPYIKNKTSKEKQLEIEKWVAIAVTAAEQLYSNGSGKGVEKKNYVISFLKEKGFIIDENAVTDSINILIEAAVYELQN